VDIINPNYNNNNLFCTLMKEKYTKEIACLFLNFLSFVVISQNLDPRVRWDLNFDRMPSKDISFDMNTNLHTMLIRRGQNKVGMGLQTTNSLFLLARDISKPNDYYFISRNLNNLSTSSTPLRTLLKSYNPDSPFPPDISFKGYVPSEA
jgi:hypothetical protein